MGKVPARDDQDPAGDFVARAVEAIGEAVYLWDIASDRLTWSRNAARVLGVQQEELLETGKAFATLLDRENITTRYDTVMHSTKPDTGDGVPFCIEYMIRPWGRDRQEVAWLEDTGCWFAGENGRPARVYGVIRRIDERHNSDQRLHFLGNFDPLTGLMNRARLGEALDEACLSAERENSSCAFLIASVDNLPVIADAYGFDIADEVIKTVAGRLQRVARGGDTVARYSDAKFGLILHDCRIEDLQVANNRFLNVANERVIETRNGPVWAMISIGSVVMPEHAQEHNRAMACAEEALAEATAQPMSTAVIYKPAQQRISERARNARCAAEIVNSLRYNRFTLAFQPIVDARTGEPVMHESLLRMQDDEGDIIAAVHLIPIAEKLGLIRLIDYNVMELTILTLKNHPQAHLTMNVSGVTANDPRWFDRIIQLLEENQEVASRLVVEITETVVFKRLDETKRFIAALRNLGCRVAIDDFGSGYTSFRNLKELDVDIVKLDGVFCDKLSENPDNQYFVRSLADLARNIDVKVIAEWVQTEEDASLLRQWGVDYFQGYLYGAAQIDHPWPSPRLDSQPAFLSAAEHSQDGRAEDGRAEDERDAEQACILPDDLPSPGGSGARPAPVDDIADEETAQASPDGPGVPPAAGGISAEDALILGTTLPADATGAPASGTSAANLAAPDEDRDEKEVPGAHAPACQVSGPASIMAQLDAELAQLKKVLDSLHRAPGHAPRKENAQARKAV